MHSLVEKYHKEKALYLTLYRVATWVCLPSLPPVLHYKQLHWRPIMSKYKYRAHTKHFLVHTHYRVCIHYFLESISDNSWAQTIIKNKQHYSHRKIWALILSNTVLVNLTMGISFKIPKWLTLNGSVVWSNGIDLNIIWLNFSLSFITFLKLWTLLFNDGLLSLCTASLN